MARVSALTVLVLSGVLAACGADGSGGSSDDPPGSGSSGGTKPPASSSSGAPATPTDPVVGLWEVSGKDERGAYVGEAEVRSEGGVYRFIRAVRYPDVKVEDGRELHWLFRGTLKKTGSTIELTSSLKRRDFIVEHGGVKRTDADGPLAVTGSLTLSANGDEVTGTITAPGISLPDTWRAKKALPANPIFTDARTIVAAHDPPSGTAKTASFALFSSYHGLDVMKPYVSRPEFRAAVHRHIVDPTDLEFYRANKNALRVVDKPIDAISIAETRARADAYRWTLAEKAERFDADIETRFLDPAIGMLPDGGAPGTALGNWNASYDATLWTGVYFASQIFRFQVTGNAKAKANALLVLDAMLKLQEITGDWTTFARTLRKASNAPLDAGWHKGTGAFANLEWREGGNNDMIKGLLYSYLLGWEAFCKGASTGNDAICTRIRTNAKHLADDVKLEGSNAPASQFSNDLPTHWLYAIVTDSIGDAISYRAKAEGYWTAGKPILKQSAVMYEQGTVDWSGQHLTSVGDMVGYFQAKQMNLGNEAVDAYVKHIDDSHENLAKQRFPNWHLLKAAFGTGGGPTSPYVKEAIARMNEVRYPKLSANIDHRISPDFCMDPYPALPWKNDWMSYPATDRTQELDSHPLFEMHPDVMAWKIGRGYRGSEGYETPGGDFLHLYWFARKQGLLTAND